MALAPIIVPISHWHHQYGQQFWVIPPQTPVANCLYSWLYHYHCLSGCPQMQLVSPHFQRQQQCFIKLIYVAADTLPIEISIDPVRPKKSWPLLWYPLDSTVTSSKRFTATSCLNFMLFFSTGHSSDWTKVLTVASTPTSYFQYFCHAVVLVAMIHSSCAKRAILVQSPTSVSRQPFPWVAYTAS